MMRTLPLLLLLAAAAAAPAAAQTWDSSGNSMLKGTFYFREMFYEVGDDYGDLYDAAALYGNITFDGNGNYTISSSAPAILVDAASGAGYYTASGTYSISASGYGFITNPALTGAKIYGLVSAQGIFVGSSTESAVSSGYNDLFIAAPVSTVTVASLKGSYTIANVDVSAALSYGVAYMMDSMFTINPDGAGNLGSFVMTGYIGGSGSSPYTQTNTTIKYTASSNALTFTIPNSNNAVLMEGQQYIYISPDGNFIFGGGQQAWNFFVGVRTGTTSTTPNFSGLYYQAGFDEDESNVETSGYGLLDTYFGSLNASSGTIIGHQRQVDVLFGNAYGLTYSDTYNVPANGAYTDAAGITKYVVGAGGAVRIGSGIGPYLGLSVALAAPQPSAGSNVWIDPQGIENAASYAPFTAGIAPGELIYIYGANLAPSFQQAATVPLPTNLNGVQVTINGTSAPIYYVSATQLAVIVPYEVSGGTVANITVTNNGSASNTVSQFIDTTAPGVWTQQANGVGFAWAQHAADYSTVTTQNPAQPGETIVVYVTGLGTVSPTIGDGAAAPNAADNTTSTISADIDGTAATVGYAGLTPQSVALYQLNLTVPTGLTAGNNVLDIQGPDSYNSEAILPVGSGTAAAVHETPSPAAVRRPHPAVKPALHRLAAPARLAPNGADPGKQ